MRFEYEAETKTQEPIAAIFSGCLYFKISEKSALISDGGFPAVCIDKKGLVSGSVFPDAGSAVKLFYPGDRLTIEF